MKAGPTIVWRGEQVNLPEYMRNLTPEAVIARLDRKAEKANRKMLTMNQQRILEHASRSAIPARLATRATGVPAVDELRDEYEMRYLDLIDTTTELERAQAAVETAREADVEALVVFERERPRRAAKNKAVEPTDENESGARRLVIDVTRRREARWRLVHDSESAYRRSLLANKAEIDAGALTALNATREAARTSIEALRAPLAAVADDLQHAWWAHHGVAAGRGKFRRDVAVGDEAKTVDRVIAALLGWVNEPVDLEARPAGEFRSDWQAPDLTPRGTLADAVIGGRRQGGPLIVDGALYVDPNYVDPDSGDDDAA